MTAAMVLLGQLHDGDIVQNCTDEGVKPEQAGCILFIHLLGHLWPNGYSR